MRHLVHRYCVNVPSSPKRNSKLILLAETINELMKTVVEAAETLITECQAAEKIQMIGARTFGQFKSFDSNFWREFRCTAVELINELHSNICNKSTSSLQNSESNVEVPEKGKVVVIWTRLLCFIIKEVKRGVILHGNSPCK